jgi:hypothetical protein
MDVEEDDVGHPFVDHLDGRPHLVGLTQERDGISQFGSNTSPDDGMVIHHEHTRSANGFHGSGRRR